MNTQFLLVFSTFPSLKEAKKIIKSLVEEKLVACGNISAPIHSIYTWKGKTCEEREYLALFKTVASKYPLLEKRLKTLHSYEVPEIIAVPMSKGSQSYLKWLSESLHG